MDCKVCFYVVVFACDSSTHQHNISQASLAPETFVYIPQRCKDGKTTACRLHIALHGCDQQESLVGNAFLLEAGYIELADANDIVVLFPQTQASYITPFNPQGCFDV
jgi:poly(3-hydroxybutyrate) depolymerase